MNEPEVIVRGLRAVLDAGLDDVAPLRRVTARCLVIGGEADQLFGDGQMATTAAHLQDARLHPFPGETHMAPVERARDVARELRAFLVTDRAG